MNTRLLSLNTPDFSGEGLRPSALDRLARRIVMSRLEKLETGRLVVSEAGQGKRITEQTPPAPSVDRARRRYDAEQQLCRFASSHAMDLVILRVGGIYGPGRLPEKRLRDRVPIIHENLAPRTNRIHADDLARVCVAAGLKGRNGEIYNVSDGTDSNMTQYFKLIADHLGLPRPPEITMAEAEQQFSPMRLSFLRDQRRVDTKKMRDVLGVTPKYSNPADGIAASIDS